MQTSLTVIYFTDWNKKTSFLQWFSKKKLWENTLTDPYIVKLQSKDANKNQRVFKKKIKLFLNLST